MELQQPRFDAAVKQITVFGGSGATGKILIRHALAREIRVRTHIRNLESLGNNLDGAEFVRGSPLNVDDVDKSLEDSCAVICVFGSHPSCTDVFCERVTKIIITSMKKQNINRLICQTCGKSAGDTQLG